MRSATIEHEIQTLIEPLVADFGAEVFDVTWGGGRLKVAVDAPGGIDTTTLSKVSRTISQELDLHDPIESRYTLEVSSPGLERRLRRPEHFAKSIGRSVTLKLRDGKTRLSGEIVEATDAEVTLRLADDDLAGVSGDLAEADGDLAGADGDLAESDGDLAGANGNLAGAGGDNAEASNPATRTVSYDDIARAQTVFQWEATQRSREGANGKANGSNGQRALRGGAKRERTKKQGASA